MFVRIFNQLSKGDAAIAGGKGASLGEMTQAAIPVPPGFVILSNAFERFLEETDLNVEIDAALDTVNHKEMHTVEYASEKIQALILGAEIPQDIADEIKTFFKELNTTYVAVRSSATAEDSASAAWAGQLDSFLNTTEETLLENVKRCWASLFTPRAIFYRFEKDLHTQKISVAVVVQKMVESEVSGIAFSVHPVTQDYNQLIIEAGFGLGEAIVSGSVTPDSYVVEKEPRRIIDINTNTQTRALYRIDGGGNEWRDVPEPKASSQVLSETQILELSEIILTIEKHYGFPCDIEWAYEGGKFYVVQSRPITTLSNQEVPTINNESREAWNKIWTTEYSLFSAWLFANQYVTSCKAILGVGFDHVILHREGDMATLYRDNDEQKLFVEGIGNKFLDKAFRENTFKILRDEKVKLESYFKLIPKEFLASENIEKFIELHNTFIPYFISVIWAPEVLKDFDIPETISGEIFKECEAIRKENENLYPRLEKFLQDCFAYIAQKEGVSEKLLRTLLPDELLAYSRDGKLPNISTLKSRYDGVVIDAKTEKCSLLIGKEASDLIHAIYQATEINAREGITGSSAFPGNIVGKVQLIFKNEEQSKVQEGDILVTTMTRPEWIPSMKKAGAFVTDAGGILSHAAIVAREMNKPCVIGTKFATQILKDGDLVEVDADNGVVRILETAQSRTVASLSQNNQESPHAKFTIPDFIKKVSFLASRPQCVQRDEAAYMFLKRWEHLEVGVVSIPLEGVNRALYLDQASINQVYKDVLEKLSTENGLNNHIKEYDDLMGEYEEAIKLFRGIDSKKENSKDAFNLFIELCIKLSDYVWAPFAIEKILDPLFKERLESEFGDQFEAVREAVVSPTRFHEYQKMRLAICECVISGQDTKQAAGELTEKFDWYGEYSYVEKLYDEEYFYSELEKLIPESAVAEKKKFHDDLEENNRHFNDALIKISDPVTRHYAQVINHYVFLRTDRVDSFKKLQTPFRRIFEMIAENLARDTGEEWNIREVISMTNDEILNYLSGASVPDKKEMAQRAERYVYYRTPKILKVVTDEKEMSVIVKTVLSSVEQDKNIKGLVAYKGIARGEVVTVFSKTDLHKVIDGSVLVARTTQVDYISAMERAVAFVTEEGGVTSHAAIIARELKKPCIVGTGNCTKILKDGDLVEVDADNGVVRILESNKIPSPEDYIRMFAGKSFSYLLTDIFLGYYNTLGVLSVQDEKSWISFLPKVVEEKTLQEGKELYLSKSLYEQYFSEFNQYIKSSAGYFESILAKEDIAVLEIKKFFELVSKHWSLYSKTEFFYTDLVDRSSMVLSIDDFDKLKLDGRAYLNKIIFEEEGYVKKLLGKIYAQTGISKDDLLDYSVNEVILLIQDDIRIPNDRLKERGIFFASKDLTMFGQDSRETINLFLSGYREKSNIIRGTIANKGKIKGVARVLVPDYDNFDKIVLDVKEMKDGEILVAETTSPDIILACKKASAIITNQGGMLSHAAIVSRELKIPCIIGTDKDVVLNIKTGDELEVDADNGVIRILK